MLCLLLFAFSSVFALFLRVPEIANPGSLKPAAVEVFDRMLSTTRDKNSVAILRLHSHRNRIPTTTRSVTC